MIPSVDFIQLESISSTNTWAKEHATEFNTSHLTCITAKEQTEGRGRQNRKWLSPKDTNLYLSLYFVVPDGSSYLANLGQIMSLACVELLLEIGAPARIKWPNDILVADRKIGGVLTETIPIEHQIGIILGLGLNVNMPEELLKTIDQPATSLHRVLKKTIEPSSLIQPLLQHFIPCLKQLKAAGFAPLRSRFEELLCHKGKKISVKLPQKTVEGICDSITAEGCLKLRLPSGHFLTLSIGEIV